MTATGMCPNCQGNAFSGPTAAHSWFEMQTSVIRGEIFRMRMTCALLVVACSIAVPAGKAQTGSEPSSTSVDADLQKGTEASRAGKFDDAERWFQGAVKASPDNAAALMDLGVAELRLGKPEEAADLLRRAVERSPELLGANLFLGIAFAQMHRVDEASTAFSREIALDPKNAQAQPWKKSRLN